MEKTIWFCIEKNKSFSSFFFCCLFVFALWQYCYDYIKAYSLQKQNDKAKQTKQGCSIHNKYLQAEQKVN